MKYHRSNKGLRKSSRFTANNKIPAFGLDLEALQTVIADEKSAIDPIIVKIDADIKKYKQYLALIDKAKNIEPQIKKRLSALEKSKKTITEAKQPNIFRSKKRPSSATNKPIEVTVETPIKYKEEFYKKEDVEVNASANEDVVEEISYND